MKRPIQILAALLVVQLGLVALTWGTRHRVTASSSQALWQMEASQVRRLTVQGATSEKGPAAPLQLAREGDGWVVASAENYPAQAEKVEALIEKLVKLKVRSPVASQSAHHRGLRVASEDYDRRLSIEAKETREIFAGNARGASMHVRAEGDEDVYLARGLSVWSIHDEPSHYIDTTYLKVAQPTRVAVESAAGSLHLQKSPAGEWTVGQLPPDTRVDQNKVETLANAASELQITAPVGKTVLPEYGLSEGTQVTVSAGDRTVRYSIGAKVDSAYYVKAEDQPFVVKVAQYALDDLLRQTADDLIARADADPPQGAPQGMMPPGMMPPGMMPPGMPPLPSEDGRY